MDERDLLQALRAGPASGDALARRFGLTRAAVWKRVQALREAGVAVDAAAGRGYALAGPLDLLDAGAIVRALPVGVASGLAGLEVAWSVDSTNAVLLHQDAPEAGTRVLLAERQTAGRGRRGRAWVSPLAANLYLSCSRRFGGGLARLGGLGLVAGVAAAEALHALGAREVGLKWPNDLVAGGRKLGGLLVEGSGEAAGSARAVVGLGINVRMPDGAGAAIDQPWTNLSALLPAAPSRDALAAALLARWLPAFDLFDAQGLAPFLPRYAALDALHGRDIWVTAGDGTRTPARALGIAADGALRIAHDGHERTIHAGETSVRGA